MVKILHTIPFATIRRPTEVDLKFHARAPLRINLTNRPFRSFPVPPRIPLPSPPCLTTKSLVVENSLRRLSHGCLRARAEAADRACTHDVRGSFAFSLGQRDAGELLFSAWIATLPRIERSGIATPPPEYKFIYRAKNPLSVFDDFKIEGVKLTFRF